jgi:bifunctional DNase/RNase
MKDPKDGTKMVDVALSRIVIREGSEQQYIFLQETGGGRGFPIVIGTVEACEIRRVVAGLQTPRPLTHQLAFETIRALESELKHVDIVDLRDNTFFAQLVLHRKENAMTAVVDARPSDAVALALRANCPIRVAQSVLDMVRTDSSGPDALPESEENPGETDKPDEDEGSDEGGSKSGPAA